jgi:very-short-patch-repair endonuclease
VSDAPPPLEKGDRGGFEGAAQKMLEYDPKLKNRSRELRSNLTDSEQKLWSKIRRKQICGVQFYRQKPIGKYIVDLYAPRAKLVVEVDGSQHCEPGRKIKDRLRDKYLRGKGLAVLRFNSRQVLRELDAVVKEIYNVVAAGLEELNPPLPPFAKGG